MGNVFLFSACPLPPFIHAGVGSGARKHEIMLWVACASAPGRDRKERRSGVPVAGGMEGLLRALVGRVVLG